MSKRYGRTPEEVLLDNDLSDSAARLYGLMAMHIFEGNIVQVGIRRLAELRNKGKSTIDRQIKELQAAGYLVRCPSTRGKRAGYMLASEIFGQKQGRETVIRSSPDGTRKRMVSVDTTRVKGAVG